MSNTEKAWLQPLYKDKIFTTDPKDTDHQLGKAIDGIRSKEVLVLYRDEVSFGEAPENAQLLEKILKAVGLRMDDVAILNYADHPDTTFKQLARHLDFQKLIAFGIQPPRLKVHARAEPYHILTLNGRQLIFADKLTVINGDQSQKKNLWNGLIKMFGIDG